MLAALHGYLGAGIGDVGEDPDLQSREVIIDHLQRPIRCTLPDQMTGVLEGFLESAKLRSTSQRHHSSCIQELYRYLHFLLGCGAVKRNESAVSTGKLNTRTRGALGKPKIRAFV